MINNKNNNVFKFNMLPWKYFPNWFRNIASFFRSIKYAYQRAVKGYCDYDLYSVRDWFFDTFPNMIEEFSENLNSYPILEEYNTENIENDRLPHKSDTRVLNEKNVYEECEKWHSILAEMVTHFRNANTDYFDSSEEARKEFDSLFKAGDIEDWIKEIETGIVSEETKVKRDEYFNKEREYSKYKEEELKKGFELFHKYFWDLWD